jgi:hypothetical protein
VKPAAEPFSTVITTTMAQRVFLNLKLLHQRQAMKDDGVMLSGVTASVGSSSRGGHAAFASVKEDKHDSFIPTFHDAPASPRGAHHQGGGQVYYTQETMAV